MKIFFVSPEVEPFAKTGGLADVSSSLPAALHNLGADITVVMPLYLSVKREGLSRELPGLEVQPGNRRRSFSVYSAKARQGYRILFLENPEFFNRNGIYGDERGDFQDNALRYGHFCAAVAELAAREKVDIVHCNDWQCGLLPWYLKRHRIASVITVHNMAFQGQFSLDFAAELGIGGQNIGDFTEWGKLNLLKSAFVYSDGITTVSKGYAAEILSPEFGCGLDGILKRRASDLNGILNGVDMKVWNPAIDDRIPAKYSRKDLSGKEKARAGLQEAFGLYPGGEPIIGMVGRMTEQKGMDLVLPSLDALCRMGFKIAVLGAGQQEYEAAWRSAAMHFPGWVGAKIAFSEQLAHLVEAGSDVFLMPSRFEPCGLNQMYSQIYGSLPIVHAVGGLKDTVDDPAESKKPSGFKFYEYSIDSMLGAMDKARRVWADKENWKQMMGNAMRKDFSWDASAVAYLSLYTEYLE